MIFWCTYHDQYTQMFSSYDMNFISIIVKFCMNWCNSILFISFFNSPTQLNHIKIIFVEWKKQTKLHPRLIVEKWKIIIFFPLCQILCSILELNCDISFFKLLYFLWKLNTRVLGEIKKTPPQPYSGKMEI